MSYLGFVAALAILGQPDVADVMAIQVKSLNETEAPYPTSILESPRLKVITYLPDAKKAYYRGSRFDWSSNIDRIEFAGHSFFGPFKNPHNPANTKRFATEHYGHHFTVIDNEPVGPSYTMSFSFPAKLGEKFEAQDAMELRDGIIRFTKPIPANRAIFGPILGVQGLEKSEITIRNVRTKAEVTIVSEQPIRRIALFGLAPVICPEPFTELALDPGQSHEWSTTYRFRTLP